jgi:hypothetical protein
MYRAAKLDSRKIYTLSELIGLVSVSNDGMANTVSNDLCFVIY